MPWLNRVPARSIVLAVALLAGCRDKAAENKPEPGARDRQPLVRFEGYVYVDASATDFQMMERVRQQASTVFPGLRRARVMVSRREVQSVSTDPFKREVVTVVDAAGERRPAIRVRYRYLARADVAPSAERQELPLAVLQRVRGIDARRVVRECTAGDPQDLRAESSIALDFDPTLEGCKAAIQAEQAAIDAARAKLPPPITDGEQIPAAEVDRLYIPVTVALEPPTGAPAGALPRFDSFDPLPPGSTPPPPSPEDITDPTLKPSTVIVDPDLAQPARDPLAEKLEAPGAGQGQGSAQAAPAGDPRDPREPAVVAPAAAPPAAQPPVVNKPEENLFDRFEEILGEIFQLKFLAVWASLLLVIPILIGDRRDRKKHLQRGDAAQPVPPSSGHPSMAPPAGRTTGTMAAIGRSTATMTAAGRIPTHPPTGGSMRPPPSTSTRPPPSVSTRPPPSISTRPPPAGSPSRPPSDGLARLQEALDRIGEASRSHATEPPPSGRSSPPEPREGGSSPISDA